MTTYNFETAFGTVKGHIAEDVCEFDSNDCIVIGQDSDNAGPIWEDTTINWGDLNDMCHRVLDNNLYGVASEAKSPTLIDSTDSYEEMQTWKAWVTNDVSGLVCLIISELMNEIKCLVSKELPELRMMKINHLAHGVYRNMFDNGVEFIDAFDQAAEARGYKV